jgi:hypothetical protein
MTHHNTPSPSAPSAKLDRLIRVGETHVGRGVFARRRIPGGAVLGEILGEILDDHPEDSSYVMELPSGKLLEPAAPLRLCGKRAWAVLAPNTCVCILVGM